MSALTDWRGTPIEAGATVLYPATLGTSAEMVEATVAKNMLTATGRVRLDVVRRSRFRSWSDTTRVSVDPSMGLTVIKAPPCKVCGGDHERP